MREPLATEEAYRARAVEALAAGDGRAAYMWAKGWISSGGGAWILDPWLVYAVSGLLMRQPRTAVHSLDLALKHWISDPRDRAVLLWVRGNIVGRQLRDPKAALADLAVAAAAAPAWLAEDAHADRDGCASEAELSRKQKGSVGPAPTFRGPGTASETVAKSAERPLAGSRPAIWSAVAAHLEAGRRAI